MLLILFIISTNSSFPFACIIFTNNTTKVIKRNGKEVNFDLTKITNAIEKANNEVEQIHQMNIFQINAIA